MILLGIDCGKQTGYFVWNTITKEAVEYGTTDFWGCINIIKKYLGYCNVNYQKYKVVVENPNLNKPVFMNKKFGNSANVINKIAQNIGMNKRDAQLIINYLEIAKIDFVYVRPSSAKWNAEYFKKISGIKERTSQHLRDAAKLVIGY